MTTIVVWVLILWTGSGTVAIDNIASREACQQAALQARVARGFEDGHPISGKVGFCFPVTKRVPPTSAN